MESFFELNAIWPQVFSKEGFAYLPMSLVRAGFEALQQHYYKQHLPIADLLATLKNNPFVGGGKPQGKGGSFDHSRFYIAVEQLPHYAQPEFARTVGGVRPYPISASVARGLLALMETGLLLGDVWSGIPASFEGEPLHLIWERIAATAQAG